MFNFNAVYRTSNNPNPPNLWDVIKSVLAAGFGVQSNENRERDFSSGSPMPYIVVGLAATVVFVLTVYMAVKIILALAVP